jgi:HD-like signal output (HDOD) protein
VEKSPSNLAQWVEAINEVEMPIFTHTAARLAEIAEHPSTSVAEFAQVILQDSAMTARVLRMANSVFYNPMNQPISTVSRAVVRLGFDPVRSITLTISMVDNLLQGKSHQQVIQELARCFHAAVQAKVFAVECGDESPEEIFIATLLMRLGQMVFWCFPHGLDEALLQELELSAGNESMAEKRALGFHLSELTVALNREWHLSRLLELALKGNLENHPRARIITLSWELCRALEKGWEGPALEAVIESLVSLLGRNREQTLKLIGDNAMVAAEMARDSGAMAASRFIPQPRSRVGGAAVVSKPSYVEPDFKLQLSILRELSALLNEKVDINAMIGTVLEGIYRGLGMDRAWFALLSPTSQALTIKYALGEDRESLVGCYLAEPGGRRPNIFTTVLQQDKAHWQRGALAGGDGEVPVQLSPYIGKNGFFLMSIAVGGVPRGLFYADRGKSGRALDEESFAGFRHFGEQATIGLSVLSKQRNG